MQVFSKSAEYALRAMARVAEDGLDRPFSAAALCRDTNIPEAFARKGFQQLVRAGILRATRGPGGGYHLRRAPEDITLYDILEAMDGSGIFDICPLGVETKCPAKDGMPNACARCRSKHPRCGLESLCPIHDTWHAMRQLMVDKFSNCTLRDIQEQSKKQKNLSNKKLLVTKKESKT